MALPYIPHKFVYVKPLNKIIVYVKPLNNIIVYIKPLNNIIVYVKPLIYIKNHPPLINITLNLLPTSMKYAESVFYTSAPQ